MKREEIPSGNHRPPTANAAPRVHRDAAYFGGARALFGWTHRADTALARDCVAVICAPIGHEYTRAHRSLRHLADRLALSGIPALRFDYHGIGDSPGGDLDPDRVPEWLASVKAAIEHARQWSGHRRVCLIGVRLGAALAALAAAQVRVELLVLWNPVVRGRPYVRELQAIAMSAERVACDIDGAVESAGFVMTAQTLAAVRDMDLTRLRPQVAQRVLVLERDDQAPDRALCDHLAAAGIACDRLAAPGWAGLMAEHQFTVVPDAALDAIVDWVEKGSGPFSGELAASAEPPRRKMDLTPFPIEEHICHFGAERHLFGILAKPAGPTTLPAIVMFNAGAVHHVGPNRVYVTLARELAAQGFPCLRFDLEGIGDSVLRTAGRENHPYPDTAVGDARAAIEFLTREFGCTSFVAMGLCSGAHTAFHAGLALEAEQLRELVLINPLTFYWAEGMSLETTRNFEDAAAYRRSMRDPARWRKLLRGGVNVRRLAEVLVAQAKTALRTRVETLGEMLGAGGGSRLSRDLRKLLGMRRPVAFFIAEGDPGRDILMAGARRTATRGLKSGALSMEMIAGADHTFSQSAPRRRLVERLGAHLRRHAAPCA